MKVPGAVAEPDSIETSDVTFAGAGGETIEGYLALASGEMRGGIIDIYEGAGHAFFADYRENFRPEPAALLWKRIVESSARGSRPGRGSSTSRC